MDSSRIAYTTYGLDWTWPEKSSKLLQVESSIKDLPANEKYKIRQEKSKPLLKDFKKWLDKSIQQVLPKSAIGKAIQYSLN